MINAFPEGRTANEGRLLRVRVLTAPRSSAGARRLPGAGRSGSGMGRRMYARFYTCCAEEKGFAYCGGYAGPCDRYSRCSNANVNKEKTAGCARTQLPLLRSRNENQNRRTKIPRQRGLFQVPYLQPTVFLAGNRQLFVRKRALLRPVRQRVCEFPFRLRNGRVLWKGPV